jgi:hypothetical protein
MLFKVKGIAETEKKIIVIKKFANKDNTYDCYSEGKYAKMPSELRSEIMSKPRTSEYLLVTIEDNNNNLEDYYNDFINDADILKKETKGMINMYKTGNYSKTALKFLYDCLMEQNKFNKNKKKLNKVIDIEPIEDYETRFLMTCGGGFRLATPYEGDLYKYDSRSYYSSIYSDEHLLIPVKPGILKTITQDEFNNMKYPEIGVYHCKVERPQGDLKKIIWINKDNYYTHYELRFMREKGLKIEMIEEPDNFLHYPRNHCKTGSEIFGKFTKVLFALKQKNVCSGVKKLLNHIWGILTKANKKVLIHNIETDGQITGDFIDIQPLDDTLTLFKVTSLYEKKFENDLARMKPFFLAKCRLTIAKIVDPIIDHVFYSHTDSLISNIPLDLIDNGELGNFKFEGFCKNGYISNGMQRSKNDDFII